MTDWVPPALILILGALLIPFLKGKPKQIFLLLLPVVAFINIINMTEGISYTTSFLDYELIFGRVDKLSKAFGYIFTMAAFVGALFFVHLKEKGEQIAAFLYAGSALGVIFAGDYLSLFIFWEIMAVASTYLIWARKTKASHSAGLRYILVHLFGGLLLFAGIIMHVSQTGTIAFEHLGLNSTASYLILFGFALNAAIPPLSAWLSDAYPEATITGAIFLSAFTTKTAVYVLVRGFAGAEPLIWAGAIMAFYGVVFAVLVNDIRRILAYHIISQVGFMVAGVGIGTALALNGAVAHAFAHILYKGLLFMGTGAVLYVTGKSKLTELGGLYKAMPITFVLYMIGALSISAFPLFSGFVSKSMVVSAAGKEHLTIIWLLLTISSAGTFLHTGLKLPYFTWFGKDSGISAKEPPSNMLAAMSVAAFICILIGVYPAVLYNILPFDAKYVPYTVDHVVWALQYLLFTGVGFFMLLKYLAGESYIVLDTDWFYRKGAGVVIGIIVNNPVARFTTDFGNKWFGEIHYFVFMKPSIWFSKILAWFDINVIDRIVNGIAWVTVGISRISLEVDLRIVDGIVNGVGVFFTSIAARLRGIQAGQVQLYGIYMFAAIIVLFFLVIRGGL